MTKKLPNRALLIPAMLMLFLSACGKEPAPSAPPPAVASPTAQQLPKPVQQQSSSVKQPASTANLFDFSNKKDPFKPFIALKTDEQKTGSRKQRPNALPIHSFDLSQLKLIGIITGGKENKAMVTDPSGKGYVIKAGMTIGKNESRITAITNAGVDVLEQFRDDSGKLRKENIRLTLPKKQ